MPLRPVLVACALLAGGPHLAAAQGARPAEAPDTTPSPEELERRARIRARGWPKHLERAVIERRLAKGMSMQMVSLALGVPLAELEVPIGLSAMGWRWEYPGGLYVFFQNGEVTNWRTIR